MTIDNGQSKDVEESDSDRQRGMLADDALTLEMVSALAGDRVLSKSEEENLGHIQKMRGARFFSDILYAITHQYFAPDIAENLWDNILRHKYELSGILKRNVRIVVAALDYLSNITDNMGSTTLVNEMQIEEIVGLSLLDGLTGLFNHSYFYQQIDMEIRRFMRYKTSLSLVLIDIDDFKKVNDKYGHREGDRVLSEMSKTLLKVARDSDICCRYGGEELAVILPLTDIYAANVIANRIKCEIAQRLPDGQMVTASIGVATCTESVDSCRKLVEMADTALYQAKDNGKNMVVVAS